MAIRSRRVRRLLVTGGSGFLGRHVVNGPAAERWEIVAMPSRSLDLTHADSVREALRDWRPAAVVHCAYRRDDRTAIVDASRNVAQAAEAVGARLVHVSTDALFRGRPAAYTEADEPGPIHAYGRDKADAERAVARSHPDAVIVRTSLLLGRRELSVHETAVRDAIDGRSEIAFFTDEVRSPVLVDDVAGALVELAGRREIRSVLHLGGPAPLSRADLAVAIARHHGWDASRLRFARLADTGLTRPGRVVLDSSHARALGLAVRGPDAWE